MRGKLLLAKNGFLPRSKVGESTASFAGSSPRSQLVLPSILIADDDASVPLTGREHFGCAARYFANIKGFHLSDTLSDSALSVNLCSRGLLEFSVILRLLRSRKTGRKSGRDDCAGLV